MHRDIRKSRLGKCTPNSHTPTNKESAFTPKKPSAFDERAIPSVSQLVSLSGVSERTARRWLSGETTPPEYLVKYVTLHMLGRIMPESWPKRWKFNSRGLLEAETCYNALSWQELTWYQFVIKSWHQSLELIPKIKSSIDYLMNKLPSAEIVQLNKHRANLEAIRQEGNATPENLVFIRDHFDQHAEK